MDNFLKVTNYKIGDCSWVWKPVTFFATYVCARFHSIIMVNTTYEPVLTLLLLLNIFEDLRQDSCDSVVRTTFYKQVTLSFGHDWLWKPINFRQESFMSQFRFDCYC